MCEEVVMIIPKKEVSLFLLNNVSAAFPVSDLVHILSGRTAVLWIKLYLNIISWRLTKMIYPSASLSE